MLWQANSIEHHQCTCSIGGGNTAAEAVEKHLGPRSSMEDLGSIIATSMRAFALYDGCAISPEHKSMQILWHPQVALRNTWVRAGLEDNTAAEAVDKNLGRRISKEDFRSIIATSMTA